MKVVIKLFSLQLGKSKIKILLPAFILGFTFCLDINAQDIIRLRSGKEMKVTIVNEASDIIRYREFDDPSGPVYSVKRDQVESIQYKKGSKPAAGNNKEQQGPGRFSKNEQTGVATGKLTVKKRYVLQDGKIVSPRNVKLMMEDYPEAAVLYEKGWKKCNMSNSCAFGVMITSLTTTIISNGKKDKDAAFRTSAIGLGIDGGFIIAAIILATTGKKEIRQAVSIYNSKTEKPLTLNFDFGIQRNGIGVRIRF